MDFQKDKIPDKKRNILNSKYYRKTLGVQEEDGGKKEKEFIFHSTTWCTHQIDRIIRCNVNHCLDELTNQQQPDQKRMVMYKRPHKKINK